MIIGKSRVGQSPGIGLVKWPGQISMTGNALLRARVLMGALAGNGLLAARTIMDDLPGNALLAARTAMDALPGNANLIHAIILHGNANLLATITADGLPGNALLSERITSDGLPGNALLSQRVSMSALPGNALLRSAYYLMLAGNALLSKRTTMSALPGSAYLCTQVVMSDLTGNGLLGERITMDDLTGNADLIIQFTTSLHGNAFLVNRHYWAIGPESGIINISGRVADPEPKGFGLQTSRQRIPGSRRTILRDEGIDGPEYGFSVYFQTDEDRLSFLEAVNNDIEDLRLFAGRSDRFYYVDRVAINPLKDIRYPGPAQKVVCYLDDPYLYFSEDQGLNLGACVLPQVTAPVYNFGSVASPLLFTVGGYYASGQLTNPYVACMNGAVQETSLSLGAGLLSGEYAELSRDGAAKYYLGHTYADDFSTNDWWQHDASQSGCALSGGQVSVPSGAWFYYRFQGHPLKDDIELTATITKSGSPIIQYSTDGATWYTAVAATEIMSGIQKVYYLSGTEKKSTIYVRFYSPTGSSMTVQDVSFSMDRDISAQADQIPNVPAGESRMLRITGSGNSKARVKTSFRSRWPAQ